MAKLLLKLYILAPFVLIPTGLGFIIGFEYSILALGALIYVDTNIIK